ncbi:MAG: GNAT family N-acetyltransferase [Caulobacteraceae bacterium]|nr:GNAT family N-acetyltransferase [Caulobacteraceae bacterium]
MRVLETERLALDEFTLEDAPYILEALTDPSFVENIGDRGLVTLDDARAYLQSGPIPAYRDLGHHMWRVTDKAAGEVVGMCGLIKREGLDDVDVGYALLPRFWGRGYAVEAAAACVAWGLKTKGYRRIVAVIKPGNAASAKVLGKLGMRPQGLIELPYGLSELWVPAA